jgi:hypothetical protein
MLTPRNAKEMAKILGSDSELRKKVHGIIARADYTIEQELLAAVRASARRQTMSLKLLSHEDATAGLKRYYEDIRAAGKFVRLW